MNFTYKQIWLINYPVMMSILMEQLINITDAIFLGHYGEVELGASALAGMYYLILYMLGFGFSLGLQVMVARRNGEQKYDETGKVFFQGLFFLVVLAVFLFLLSNGATTGRHTQAASHTDVCLPPGRYRQERRLKKIIQTRSKPELRRKYPTVETQHDRISTGNSVGYWSSP